MKKILSLLLAAALLCSMAGITAQAEEPLEQQLVFEDTFTPGENNPQGWTMHGTNATHEITAAGRLRATATGAKNADYTITRELGNALTGVYQIDMTINTNSHNDSVWFGVNDSAGGQLIRGRVHASGVTGGSSSPKSRLLINYFDVAAAGMKNDQLLAEPLKGQDFALSIKVDTNQKKFWVSMDGKAAMPSGVGTDGLYYADPAVERENNDLQTFYLQLSKPNQNEYAELAGFSLAKCVPLEAPDVDALLAEAKSALKITDLTQNDPSNLQHDLTLPGDGLNGTAISWTSGNTNLISDSGVLNQTEIAKLEQAAQVVMTATFSLQGKSVTETYTFTIQPPSIPSPGGLPIADAFDSDTLDGWTFEGTGATKKVENSRLVMTKTAQAEYTATREISAEGAAGVYYMETKFQARLTNAQFWIYVFNSAKEEVIRVRVHSAGRNQKPGTGNDGRILMTAYDTENNKTIEPDLAEFTKDQEHVLGIKMDTQQKKYWAYLDGDPLCAAEGLAMPRSSMTEDRYEIAQVGFAMDGTNVGSVFSLDAFSFAERTEVEEKLEEAKKALKITDLTQDDPSNLQQNLTLPEDGLNGTKIAWTSGNTNLVSDSGVLNQTEIAKLEQAAQVVMTATFSLQGKTVRQTYAFTIQPPAKPGDDEEKLLFRDTFDDNDDGWTYTGGNSTKKVEGGKLTITSSGSGGFVASRTISENGAVGIYYLDAKLQSYTTTAEFWLRFYNANGEEVIKTRLHAAGTSTPGTGNYTRLLVTGYDESQQKATEQLAGEFTKNAQHTVRFKIDTDEERIWTYIDGKPAGPAEGFRFAGTGTATEFNLAKFTVETGSCANGNYIAVDELTCTKLLTTENKLREAADALLISALADGDASNLQQDLTLPGQGLYDTAITWQSSQPQLIGNDGKRSLAEIAKLQAGTPVDMTATFTLLGQSITKIFHFVLRANENEGWFMGVQEQFTAEGLDALWTRAAAENIIRMEQGALLLRRVNALAGMQAKRWLIADGKAIEKTTVVEADITAETGAQMECLSLDGKAAFRALVRSGAEQPELVIQTGAAQETTLPYAVGHTARIRALIDPQAQTVTVMVNGKTVVTDVPLLEAVQNLAAVSFSIPEDSQGEMTVDNLSVLVRGEDAPQVILDSAGLEALFAADYLYENVKLPLSLPWNGKAVWQSSDTSIISDQGEIFFTTEVQQAQMTVRVYAGEEAPQYAQRTFPVRIAAYQGENLALGKPILSQASSASGKLLTNLNDGDMNTMWMTAKYEENPSFTITLDSATAADELDFVNAFTVLSANDTVRQYLVETSVDGVKWEEALRTGSFGTMKTMPRQARYVRYTVLEKERGNSGLVEFQVFFSPTDAQRAAADAKLLKLTAKSPISGNITLPLKGKYGSAITWKSDRMDIMTENGQFHEPQAREQFVMTAVVTSGSASVEKSFPFYTKAPSGGGSGNGGGGGGGRPATGGGSGTGVALPPISGGQDIPESPVYFQDVPQGHWAKTFIEALFEQNVVCGYNEKFEPDNGVTREEFVKMIIIALGIKPVQGTLSFQDVRDSDWFAPYVAAAVEHGIVSGVSETEFGAGREITREDMAVLCTRALAAAGASLPDGAQQGLADADQIAEYAQSAVKQLVQLGVISGDTNGQFRPKANLTRAEAAKVIYMIRNK